MRNRFLLVADASSAQRQALIEHIVTLMRRPQPKIRPVLEFRATNDRWYRPDALPAGEQLTEEVRQLGFSFQRPDGTFYGFIEQSRDILSARHETAERIVAASFRAILQRLNDDELHDQADYWLPKV